MTVSRVVNGSDRRQPQAALAGGAGARRDGLHAQQAGAEPPRPADGHDRAAPARHDEPVLHDAGARRGDRGARGRAHDDPRQQRRARGRGAAADPDAAPAAGRRHPRRARRGRAPRPSACAASTTSRSSPSTGARSGGDADVVRGDSVGRRPGLGRLLVGLGHRHMAVLSGPMRGPHRRGSRDRLPPGGRRRGRPPRAARALRRVLDRQRPRDGAPGDGSRCPAPPRCSPPTTSSPSARCMPSPSSGCASRRTSRSWRSMTCPRRWSPSRS